MTAATASRPATSAERAQMDAARAEVRRVYLGARAKVEVLTARLWLSSEEKAIQTNVRELGERIDTWAEKHRPWAEKGRRDDGTAYDVARWLQHGRELAEAASYHAGLAVDSHPFTVVAQTAAATAKTAATVAIPFLWPTWAKWAAGGALVVVGLVVARPYVQGARSALGALRP